MLNAVSGTESVTFVAACSNKVLRTALCLGLVLMRYRLIFPVLLNENWIVQRYKSRGVGMSCSGTQREERTIARK